MAARMRAVMGTAWVGADGADLLFLQGAEEAALEVEGELADFVEEDGAAFGGRRAGRVLARVVPGMAPLTWPKSSLSIRAGTSEPQSTGMKGLLALGPLVWMERATSSLPVPDSPTMRTGWVVAATLERMR